MRDPLKRIESWYCYRSRNKLKNPEHPKHENYTGNISFNDFVEKFLLRNKLSELTSQYDFMRLDNGSIGVDRIFLMNQMNTVSDYLTEKIGIKIVIPQKNISPKRSVRLKADLEKKLRHYLRMDIELYDFVKRYGVFDRSIHSDEFDDIIHNKAQAKMGEPYLWRG